MLFRSVKVFSLTTGDPLYHISGPGPGQFDLQNPMGITLDPSTGEIIRIRPRKTVVFRAAHKLESRLN